MAIWGGGGGGEGGGGGSPTLNTWNIASALAIVNCSSLHCCMLSKHAQTATSPYSVVALIPTRQHTSSFLPHKGVRAGKHNGSYQHGYIAVACLHSYISYRDGQPQS